MLRTLRATPRQVFWRVELPFALPGVFSGARIAAPYAAIAALIAETAGGSGGLADSMHQQLDTPLIGAGVTLLAVLALALYAAVGLLERWLLPWARERERAG
jgi:NitT/TauT family transport system permease protein